LRVNGSQHTASSYNLEKSMEWNVPDIVFARVSKLLACWPVGLAASIDAPASPRCASQPFAVMTKATAVVMVGGALLSPALALAGEPYVGAGAGYSFADPHYVELAYDRGSISLGGPVTGKSYRLFVGYSFSPYVALEGGRFKADDLRGKIGPFSIGSTYTFVGGQRRITVSGASLDVVGTLPVNEHLSVLAARVF
jgi:hypothetical protein